MFDCMWFNPGHCAHKDRLSIFKSKISKKNPKSKKWFQNSNKKKFSTFWLWFLTHCTQDRWSIAETIISMFIVSYFIFRAAWQLDSCNLNLYVYPVIWTLLFQLKKGWKSENFSLQMILSPQGNFTILSTFFHSRIEKKSEAK
jgi:hypothetical protein